MITIFGILTSDDIWALDSEALDYDEITIYDSERLSSNLVKTSYFEIFSNELIINN
jgi:hypothetical protein